MTPSPTELRIVFEGMSKFVEQRMAFNGGLVDANTGAIFRSFWNRIHYKLNINKTELNYWIQTTIRGGR